MLILSYFMVFFQKPQFLKLILSFSQQYDGLILRPGPGSLRCEFGTIKYYEVRCGMVRVLRKFERITVPSINLYTKRENTMMQKLNYHKNYCIWNCSHNKLFREFMCYDFFRLISSYLCYDYFLKKLILFDRLYIKLINKQILKVSHFHYLILQINK